MLKNKLLGITISSVMMFTSISVFAQESRTHIIQKGETLSSIAPKYGTTVGDIMRLNGMNASSKLSIGQKIKIPAEGAHVAVNTHTEETTKPLVKNDNTSEPVSSNAATTHVVLKGESLYSIGKKYKISLADLRSWNGLSDNFIKQGQVLKLTPSGDTAPVENKIVPAAETEVNKISKTTGHSVEIQSTTGDTVPKVDITTPASTEKLKVSVQSDSTVIEKSAPNGGYYSNQYASDIEGKKEASVEGISGIFQNQSGWTNGKYFIEMNEVKPGTIVKVSTNGTSVYAKVLWTLTDTQDNKGLQFRLCDAAAAVLGIPQGSKTFNIKVEYYK